MSCVLTEIGTATNPSRTLIFVRGFSGHHELPKMISRLVFGNAARRRQTTWYRGLRRWGYEGRLMTFRWDCHWIDCFSAAARDARADKAAEALCELVDRFDHISPCSTSVLGFSMGGWIIQRALRIARRNDVCIRRAYLLGAAAPRAARWPELMECVSEGLWNFYSTEDEILEIHYPNSIGLQGLAGYYERSRDVDCTSLVDCHDDWPYRVDDCLRRARLSPAHL
jgi:pimeloyl-ACP methyl ester carboxylesterase